MSSHAILSASSSKRWLNCPPSAKLCAEVEDTTSEYAKEGTDAHTLCEYKVKSMLGIKMQDPTDSLSYYNEEMERCANDYASYVMEVIEDAKNYCKDPLVLIEQKLDFSKFVPEGFGTGDCLIIADKMLYIIDFKYGKGVEVESEDNSQMMCYAIGALELFNNLYDIEEVCMVIYQPRIENISVSNKSVTELYSWAENTLKPIAELAYEGKGEFKAGDHCQFCKIKATCRKRTEYNMELAKYDFEEPAELTDEEISSILIKSSDLVSWVSDVKDYALQQALLGKNYPKLKLVEGRSNRKYLNEEEVATAVKNAGYDPYEKKLLGITAMTNLLGRTKFNEVLGDLIYKPQGKPTLVLESDKRPAMEINDFIEEREENKYE